MNDGENFYDSQPNTGCYYYWSLTKKCETCSETFEKCIINLDGMSFGMLYVIRYTNLNGCNKIEFDYDKNVPCWLLV